MTIDSQFMNVRQQNYMFAYNILPAFMFRSDFARLTAFAHPKGFLYFQRYWEHLAKVFPPEHVVSAGELKTEAYQLADDIYCLVVTMPPAERFLEVQYVGLVFQPKVRYFVAGRNGTWEDGSRLFTLREVTPSGHGACGSLREPDPEQFLASIAGVLNVVPNIRPVDVDEMRVNAEHIETFPAVFQMTPPEAVFVVAAAYRVISLKMGDSSGIPPGAVMRIYEESGEPMRRAVELILHSAKEGNPAPTAAPRKWWQFWK
jgi:hypothetical protein